MIDVVRQIRSVHGMTISDGVDANWREIAIAKGEAHEGITGRR